MSQEKREVKSTLTIELPTASLKALEELGKQIQDVGRKADKMHKDISGGGGKGGTNWAGIANAPRAAPAGGAAGAAGTPNQLLGMMGGSAGVGSMVKGFLALAAVQKSVQAATVAANIAHDPYMTSGQGARKFIRDVVPGGGTALGLADALSGRAYKMEQADIQGRKTALYAQGQTDIQAFNLGYQPQQAGLRQRAAGLAGASAITSANYDRSTATGERAYREQARILPVARAIAQAERESRVASAERVATEGELSKIVQRQATMRDKYNSAVRETNKLTKEGASGPVLQAALREQEATGVAYSAVTQQKFQSEQQVAESKKREAEAKGNVRRQKAELADTRAAILEERVQTSAATATSLGGMDQFDRNFALNAVKKLQSGISPDRLHPEELAAARSIAPNTVGKIQETFGAGTAQYAELQKIAPADAAGNLDEMRTKANQLRNEATRERMGADQDVARGSAAAGERLGEAVTQAVNTVVDMAIKKIYTDLRLGRNAQ